MDTTWIVPPLATAPIIEKSHRSCATWPANVTSPEPDGSCST